MLQLTDEQANHVCDVIERRCGVIVIDKDNPPAWAQPYFGIALQITGVAVSIATNGLTSMRAFKDDAAQTLFNLILMPGTWHGVNKLLALRHEVRHWRQWWQLGWNGSATDKVFQPMPVEYVVNKNGAAFFEGQAYAAQVELMVLGLGATRDEVASYLAWLRDVELPSYNLGTDQIADCLTLVDSVATGAFAGAQASADTQIVVDELRAMQLLPAASDPTNPSPR